MFSNQDSLNKAASWGADICFDCYEFRDAVTVVMFRCCSYRLSAHSKKNITNKNGAGDMYQECSDSSPEADGFENNKSIGKFNGHKTPMTKFGDSVVQRQFHQVSFAVFSNLILNYSVIDYIVKQTVRTYYLFIYL